MSSIVLSSDLEVHSTYLTPSPAKDGSKHLLRRSHFPGAAQPLGVQN
jgi:hypothetical protein